MEFWLAQSMYCQLHNLFIHSVILLILWDRCGCVFDFCFCCLFWSMKYRLFYELDFTCSCFVYASFSTWQHTSGASILCFVHRCVEIARWYFCHILVPDCWTSVPNFKYRVQQQWCVSALLVQIKLMNNSFLTIN